MLYKATAAVPSGLKLMMNVSALRSKLVPISVKVVYLLKLSKTLTVLLFALVIYFNPSQPLKTQIPDAKASMTKKDRTSCCRVICKKKKFTATTIKKPILSIDLINNILPNVKSACMITRAVFMGKLIKANRGYHLKNNSYPLL